MQKSKADNSYKNILKGNTIFGGVQIFQIFITLLRCKLVAVILGPSGMGIASLFNSTSETIRKFASFGLNLAIVKDVAACKDEQQLSQTVVVIRHMLLFTALAGMLVCTFLSSWFSKITFGNDNYTSAMILLGAVVFFTVIWQGQMSILQGLHKVKILSKATLIGSLTGLCIGIPLYWLFGTNGIVPAMLAYAIAMTIFYGVSTHRLVGTNGIKFIWKEHKQIVTGLLTLGLILMIGDSIGTMCQYATNVFIRQCGSLEDVGFWQGANSLTNQYAGVIFTALAMDFMPRLTAAIHKKEDFAAIVDRQTELASLLVAPLAALLILAAPLVVEILLSEKYRIIVPLIRVLGIGLILKTAMYPIGYITLAQDNKKVFFWLEAIWGNLQLLILTMGGYYIFGLMGLGYAIVIDATLCIIIYSAVNYHLYKYHFSSNALRCVLYSIIIGIGTYYASTINNTLISYSIMGIITAIAVTTTIFGLLRRLRNKKREKDAEKNA